MKPKLFFVINALNPGGAERVVTNLANYFNDQGFQVFMICLNDGRPVYPVNDGVHLIQLTKRDNRHGIFDRMRFGLITFFKLLHLLIKEKPGCVISFMTSSNLWAGLTCSLTGVPFIVSERITPDLTINSFNPFLKWLSYMVYRQSKAIVLPAKAMEACLKKTRSFRKLDNFISIKNYVSVFQPLDLKPVHDKKFILGVGRLTQQKGFDQLIEAYSKIQTGEIDLVIVGEGMERESLTKKIEELGLSKQVFLVGSKDNLQDYYAQAELFVLSSRNEGYPNALIEAMSMGCPSIAMDCEFGPSEIIENGLNGFLVEDENIVMLAHSMSVVLNNDRLKKRLSKQAKLINETNSQKAITSKWEELILSQVQVN
ncbi:glycosyltransferase [Pedobacter gandavensis]|uniref:glycosyltransferase n=1 Tax=Pedobacter gandavensis TaxID=2679963 RepID=UPI00292F6A11|nr:glycosyltransferase [Pedobacter gandavensis]